MVEREQVDFSQRPRTQPSLLALRLYFEMNPRIERPILLLRLVFEVDLGKRQGHAFRKRLAAGSAMRDASDDDAVQLAIRYSCWPLPAFRWVMVASLMCVPVAAGLQSRGDALSTLWTMERSWKVAFPEPPPLPAETTPAFATPHENESTSISSLCLSSSDRQMSPDLARCLTPSDAPQQSEYTRSALNISLRSSAQQR